MLTNLTVILFIGLLMGLISKKLEIPAMLLLMISGAVIKNITLNGSPVFVFSDEFLISVSILALVMIVFEGSSNFTLHDLDTYTTYALKTVVMFFVFNMLFLSIATYYLFGVSSMILSLLFAAVMAGTDPGSVLSLFQTKSNKITELLKFESIVNTPVMVLIPFILLDLMELDANVMSNFLEYLTPFMQQIITGIGTGVFLGIIVFRFMKKFYSDKLSPLMLLTTSLLTYIMAESIGGNGVLAVTVFGVFFGNTRVKKKIELKGFSNSISNILEIVVFVLIGFVLPIHLPISFILKSILLFGLMIILRFIAIELVYYNDHLNLKERIFISLNCAKGIAVAVIAFILSNYVLNLPILVDGVKLINSIPLIQYPGAKTIIDLMILFMLYSIILSSIMARFSQKFIRLKVEQ